MERIVACGWNCKIIFSTAFLAVGWEFPNVAQRGCGDRNEKKTDLLQNCVLYRKNFLSYHVLKIYTEYAEMHESNALKCICLHVLKASGSRQLYDKLSRPLIPLLVTTTTRGTPTLILSHHSLRPPMISNLLKFIIKVLRHELDRFTYTKSQYWQKI